MEARKSTMSELEWMEGRADMTSLHDKQNLSETGLDLDWELSRPYYAHV